MASSSIVRSCLALSSLSPLIAAHGHHQTTPADLSLPIDTALWLHIVIQSLTWFFLFPTTMLLGLIRHRLHIPLATVSLALTTLGYFLGHKHQGGRTFPHSAHGSLASFIVFYLLAQTVFGIYLKLHLKIGEKTVRPMVLLCHGLLGKALPVLAWFQIILGTTTLQSWCNGQTLGRCLSQYIIGSSCIVYGVLSLIMLKAGASWLARRCISQDFVESMAIVIWGSVNAVLLLLSGTRAHESLRHAALDLLLITGGTVGMWHSRDGQRSFFAGLVMFITGWSMSDSAHGIELATKVHNLLGYTVMAAGLSRNIEVCLLPGSRSTVEDGEVDQSSTTARGPEGLRGKSNWSPVQTFQLMPSYLLVTSGILSMSATDEELHWADALGMDPISYALIGFSLAFLLFLWIHVLIEGYTTAGGRGGCRQSSQSSVETGHDSATRSRGLYSRLADAVDVRRSRHVDEGDDLPMGDLSASSVPSDPSSSPRPPAYAKEAASHILFETGDTDAEELEDPFDDEGRLARMSH